MLRSVGLALALLVTGCPSSQRAEKSVPAPAKATAAPQAPSPTVSSSSASVPALQGRVNDYADLLTAADEAELGALYESLERDVGSQIALLTVGELRGASIEEYSLRVANAWGLGRREMDDGVLITVAVAEKSLRIEVGYGLELIISDDVANGIVSRMVPELGAGNFFKGLQQGSLETVELIRARQGLVGKRSR